ncbi:Major intrinsic protein [Dillenia turbinata]|uniref:Major intrinsic protein n=1 Tax=Dillenia turbinata TaxID=194707 RepID=A0AAN8YU81_9MAGN
MARITLGNVGEIMQRRFVKALFVEFICTYLFVFAAVGSAMANEKLNGNSLVGLLYQAVAQALVVSGIVSAGLHISGGHINPAVTLSLAVGGHCTIIRSSLYWLDQLTASTLACYSLNYMTGGLAVPVHQLASGVGYTQGLLMESVLTFSLLFTVYGTMVDPKSGAAIGLGPVLVGLVVGANTLAGGAFTGASMNPARSFGPAFVSGDWTDHWVYWVGPLFGGGLSGYIYENFFMVTPPAPNQPVFLAEDYEDY